MPFDRTILNDIQRELREQLFEHIERYSAEGKTKTALEILTKNRVNQFDRLTEITQIFLSEARGTVWGFLFQPVRSGEISADQIAQILDYVNSQIYKYQYAMMTFMVSNDHLTKIVLENGYSGQLSISYFNQYYYKKTEAITIKGLLNFINHNRQFASLELPPPQGKSTAEMELDDFIENMTDEESKIEQDIDNTPIEEIIRNFIANYYWLRCVSIADKKIAGQFGLKSILQENTKKQLNNWLKIFRQFRSLLNANAKTHYPDLHLMPLRVPQANPQDVNQLIDTIDSQVVFLIGSSVRIRIIDGIIAVKPVLQDSSSGGE